MKARLFSLFITLLLSGWLISVLYRLAFVAGPPLTAAALPPQLPLLDCNAPVRIMPLGDELTVGVGSSQNTGYRQVLYHSLRGVGYDVVFVGGEQDGATAVPAFDTDHEGHIGWTADLIATNVYTYLVNNPADIILLHVGPDENNADVTAVMHILDEIDRYEQDNGINIAVLLAQVINNATPDPTITEFNNNLAISATARTTDTLFLVDMENSLDYILDMADNTHPNDLGYFRMARTWQKSLVANINPPACTPVQVQKTADTEVIISGSSVNFTIFVTNTGNAGWRNITADDPLAPACSQTVPDLLPDNSYSYNCTLDNVTNSFLNYITVAGTHVPATSVSNTHLVYVVTITPALSLSLSPPTQIVLAGETAVFTATITNTGTVPLTLNLTSSPADTNCTSPANNLATGEAVQYSCSKTNVTQSFTPVITATGIFTIPHGNIVSTTAVASASISAVQAGLALAQTPVSQTVSTGETAVFTITLTNTGSTTLQNILLTAPQSPTCEKTISQLNTGETHTYTCSQANMTADFTHTITATSTVSGTNTPIIVTNNVFINIRPAITLTITPAPSTQPEPGGTFNFAVTIQNNSQESVFLSSLSDSLLGNLTDTGNTTLVNTNCQAGTAVSPATSYNCTYTTTFNGQPGIYTSTVTATVRDDDFSTASSTTTPTITISNTLPVLQSHLSLTPATLPASGGTITLTLHITNTSNFDTVTLTNLTEDNLGNLNGQGTCALPQTLLPTAVYTCTLTTTVTGDTDQTITYTLHITANDDDAASINANTTATLKIAPLYALFIPLINYNTVIGEPNNICEEAYPLAPNISYHFLPDDINDWYWFDLSDTGDVTVALTNFIPVDGQIVVWRGSCDNLEFIANNGNFESTKIINLGTQENGRYYIWIINDGPLNTHQPYTLQITYTPTPSVR